MLSMCQITVKERMADGLAGLGVCPAAHELCVLGGEVAVLVPRRGHGCDGELALAAMCCRGGRAPSGSCPPTRAGPGTCPPTRGEVMGCRETAHASPISAMIPSAGRRSMPGIQAAL